MWCVCLEFVLIVLFLYHLIFSYYARVPLNGGWRTTGGTRTTVITPYKRKGKVVAELHSAPGHVDVSGVEVQLPTLLPYRDKTAQTTQRNKNTEPQNSAERTLAPSH
jgi:hypothetical protein